MKTTLASILCISLLSCTSLTFAANRVIIFVWDGLRPDSVTPKTTPHLYQLMKNGTQFTDNHATFPTFTMMNAASFATGDRAGKTGFFGNTLWQPGSQGTDASSETVDFNQPVFTEDYKILETLNENELLFAKTLFSAAHQKNMNTAAVGKTGAAFMQDYFYQGITLDETHINPLDFAKKLQKNGYSLPDLSPNHFAKGKLTLTPTNGKPTKANKIINLADDTTPDPDDNHGSPFNQSNEYLADIYFKKILPEQKPQLSVLWLRNPDTTEHYYGPGTKNYFNALKNNDAILGNLLGTLKQYHMDSDTNIIIVSDHAHSSVSGPTDLFPLRSNENHLPDTINSQGYSVSGEIRLAHMLSQAGFHAFDGLGCAYNPILSGIKRNGSQLYPTQIDKTGAICGKINEKFTTKSYIVPKKLPSDAIIVAANGGSDYLYIPSHNKVLVSKIVSFLASHDQLGAIFIDEKRYEKMHGTIPMSHIGVQNSRGRGPDVIVGFSYNEKTKINGLPGIEFSDSANLRGMHGSFSPVDVHNFLMAYGPDFRAHFKDALPTGNIDVAPTVAYLLGLDLPDTDGRVLFEAMKHARTKRYEMKSIQIKAEKPLEELTIYNAVDQVSTARHFTSTVDAKVLDDGNNRYYYFEQASGIRW